MQTPNYSKTTPVKANTTPQALGGRILEIRGQRVLLDAELAELYEVDTKRLNEAVKKPDFRTNPIGYAVLAN